MIADKIHKRREKMIAVKNPKELACCRCKHQKKHRCSNGWTCSLTQERGYPCYADALDRLDNCPLCPPIEECKYAYGTKHYSICNI